MNINDYIKSRIKNSNPIPTESTPFNPQDAISKYSGMNEEQLMGELFLQANIARQNGNLDNATLDNFYTNAKSYLTPEQAEKMKNLIIELKK